MLIQFVLEFFGPKLSMDPKLLELDIAVELHAPIYRDWGIHCKHQDEMDKAIRSFEKSIEANPSIFKSLVEHSICKLHVGRADEALESAQRCLELFPDSPEAKHVYANCLYELNDLEETLKRAYNTHYEHPKDHLGGQFIGTVMMNLETAVCDGAGPLLRRYIGKLKRQQEIELNVPDKNREGAHWTEATEKDCDVISICEESTDDLSPLQRTRRTLMTTLKHDIYYDGTVRDQIRFWEALKRNKSVALTQTPDSAKLLTKITDRALARMNQYENMLYTREPLFAKKASEKGRSKSSRMIAFYYMQQNIRREAFSQLERVKSIKDFDELLKYVEQIMTSFYALKSATMFPRKYELMTEIYNVVALKYLSIYQAIPPKMMDREIDERLLVLLRTPTIRKTTTSTPNDAEVSAIDRFGDRSAFNDPDYVDPSQGIFNKRTQYFLKRISYATKAIEKAYLNHQLSEHFLNCGRLEESQQFARESVTQATQCRNNVWKFVAYLNIVRADAMKRNFSRVTRNLKEMAKIAAALNKYLEVFVRTGLRTAEDIEVLRENTRKSSRLSRSVRNSSVTSSRMTSAVTLYGTSQTTLNAQF